MNSKARAGYLRGFARGLDSRRDYLLRVQMHNNGKPRIEAEIDLDDAIATFDYYAGLAEGLDAARDARVDHAGVRILALYVTSRWGRLV